MKYTDIVLETLQSPTLEACRKMMVDKFLFIELIFFIVFKFQGGSMLAFTDSPTRVNHGFDTIKSCLTVFFTYLLCYFASQSVFRTSCLQFLHIFLHMFEVTVSHSV